MFQEAPWRAFFMRLLRTLCETSRWHYCIFYSLARKPASYAYCIREYYLHRLATARTFSSWKFFSRPSWISRQSPFCFSPMQNMANKAGAVLMAAVLPFSTTDRPTSQVWHLLRNYSATFIQQSHTRDCYCDGHGRTHVPRMFPQHSCTPQIVLSCDVFTAAARAQVRNFSPPHLHNTPNQLFCLISFWCCVSGVTNTWESLNSIHILCEACVQYINSIN